MSTSNSPGLYGSKGGDTTPSTPATPAPAAPDTNGDDVLHAGGGSETLYGGKGQDTAVFEGDLSDYLISFDPATWQVVITDRSGHDGTHHLSSIEQLRFGDTTIALDGLNGRMRPADDAAASWQTVDGYPPPPPAPDTGELIVYVGITTPGIADMWDNVVFEATTTGDVESLLLTSDAWAFAAIPDAATIELAGVAGIDSFAQPLLITA